ncbi:MAG: TonB-dependent receptor [candidate division KSB1 bacterium]|nr:TonB-dependent receptor [candidate division KSB1 bacterium]MDZ7294109.1 TonB-dependent receptor [candidate division KSB1 bacterium]MDZ7412993.1 TonB-dependent receptor [candidate division KSB1 bacterium]
MDGVTRTAREVGIWSTVLTVLLISAAWWSGSSAGTTGKLSGRVMDKANQPLPAANIVLAGTLLGAATDAQGYYHVLNVPPGRYEVKVSFIGYKTRVIQDVVITADRTTTLDVTLEESTIEGETVVVVAEKPVVELNLTSSMAALGSQEIQIMPVRSLQDIVDLQAGVVDGHFRGGRLGEVQYQINGVTVNNSYDNSSSLQLDRSVLQEVQVISGTFDAEYGQAMSGVVNVVLKSGTERFSWNGEVYLGDYMYTTGERRGEGDKFRPLAIQNYQLSVSGPTGLPKTYFLVSARHLVDNGYIFGERRFVPTDRADFEKKVFTPSGDGKEMPLEYTRELSGVAKLTNRSLKNVQLDYQAVYNVIRGKRYNFAFRLNPDGMTTQRTFSLVHGIDWTHTVSGNTFYNLSLRQNYFDYRDYVYENVHDSRYDAAGPPMGDYNYELGAVVQGVDLTRFRQRTNAAVLKGAITSQMTRTLLCKAGVEAQVAAVQFGVPGYVVGTGGTLITRHVNEPPDYPDVATYHPVSLMAYGQGQLEWRDFVVRAGARLEYFDARATVPSDLQNPANAIAGAPPSYPKRTSRKISLAPRIGVSYPMTESAALFFAYGHFYQMPALGQIFSNSDYRVLDELQAGGISYGVMGNPDIRPERTVQYEFGYKHALTPFLGLDVSIFYKDIRDLLGVEFVSTYAAAEYARLTNVDFGNVLGFTVAVDQRRIGPLSTMVDYTWQKAMGNSSDPRETATRAAAGEDPRPRQIPLNWDQRHTLNATVLLESPKNFSVSAVLRYGSGQPYTPSLKAGFGGGLETNSGRKPPFFRVDLRGEKYFRMGGVNLSLFARIVNLLDTRFVNGFVFDDTGSPDYSLNPVGQRATLANPGRYYPPRRVEVGIAVNAGL